MTEGAQPAQDISSFELPVQSLRWECPESWLDFEDTRGLPHLTGIEGQKQSIEALRFGMECAGLGQNVFVRGLQGGGRLELVAELVRSSNKLERKGFEHVYVRNFSAPDCPRLIRLPQGQGRIFRRRVRQLAEFVQNRLTDALESNAMARRQEDLRLQEKAEVEQATKPFQISLEEAGLELVSLEEDGVERPALLPLVDGEPLALKKFEELRTDGKVSEEDYRAVMDAISRLGARLDETIARTGGLVRRSAERVRQLAEGPARWALREVIDAIRKDFPGKDVGEFLDEILEDVLENQLEGLAVKSFNATELYRVNVLEPRALGGRRPVIVETHPTLPNLVGAHGIGRGEEPHMSIQAGCLLRANGGYLILDASDLLSESGAWKVLVRTLSSGMLEITPPELGSTAQVQSFKPEPIPVEVRVILVGNVKAYRALDQNDDDFGDLFKVLVDFDSTLTRDMEAANHYAGVLARLAEQESLLHFTRGAIQAMVEYGARLADRPQRLTSHFTKIEDTAREAAFLSERDGEDRVRHRHVTSAIARARTRADLPARRYRALLKGGTYNVETRGRVVGQVNGLATHRAGQITYGFPARLTASVGSGIRGIIDIESQASLSGSFHTKGVQILDGLLRHLLRSQHPIRFTASLAFEQSYGNIDGDSASGAEICCLLSGLSQVPIDQGIAMTGAIDQRGRVQAVGGVNDKIEGFFDVCADSGLTGEQGVIVPRANVGDLMLREDVVEACRKDRFRVFAVEWIHQALEILTGKLAGAWEDAAGFPSGSILCLARERAHEYWIQSSRKIQHSAEEAETH